MEKVCEIKLVQKGHVEFKGSTVYSDEKVQEIVGNMNLKFRREGLKLEVISMRVVSCKEPEMQLPKLNWGLRRVKKGWRAVERKEKGSSDRGGGTTISRRKRPKKKTGKNLARASQYVVTHELKQQFHSLFPQITLITQSA